MNASDQFLTQGEVKDFQPNPIWKTFDEFLTGLFCECDHFTENYQNPPFYTSIQNGFLNFQKTLNGEWGLNTSIYMQLTLELRCPKSPNQL